MTEDSELKILPDSEIPTFQTTLDSLKSQKNWYELRDFLQEKAELYPDDYFILSQLSHAYGKLDDDRKELYYSQQTLELVPDDNQLIYNHALALQHNGMISEAISYLDMILAKSIDEIAYGEYGGGKKDAISLYNDALYAKGVCHTVLGNYKEALYYVQSHLSNRRRGLFSYYWRRDVLRLLKILSEKSKRIGDQSKAFIGVSMIEQPGDEIPATHPLIPINEKKKEVSELKNLPKSEGPAFQATLNYLRAKRNWDELRDFLQEKADQYPEDYFILTELSQAYRFVDNSRQALYYSQKALELVPDDDELVIYNHGMALQDNEMYSEALPYFNMILEKSIEEIAYGEHGEGMKYAKGLYNDSLYMKGVCYMELGNKEEALHYIQLHLSNRHRGQYSAFSRQEVIQCLNELLGKK